MPNMFAAIAYDGANLLADTIRKAGTNRKAIRDELAKTKDFVGVTGTIAFTEQRDVVKDYRHLVIKNVEFIIYEGK
jgi:branched-chain amino acid transport system substrate-binding protein